MNIWKYVANNVAQNETKWKLILPTYYYHPIKSGNDYSYFNLGKNNASKQPRHPLKPAGKDR